MISAITELSLKRKSIIMAITEEGGVGPKMFQHLLMRIGPPESLLTVSSADFEDFPQMNDAKVGLLLKSIENIDDYSGKIHEYISNEIEITSILDDDYPDSLRNIDAPPSLIYYKGDKNAWARDYIALVGTTKATQGGLRLAVDLAKEFAKRGYGVVSGLAAGIDSAAHLGALKEKGANIAVVGCGILNIYPEENSTLADLVADTGLLLSEYPPDRKVTKVGLVLRNRIISALSRAVVVIQVGDETRGELRTAAFANKQARPLFYGDPDGNLDYERIKEWPGAIIKSTDSIDEIISYMV